MGIDPHRSEPGDVVDRVRMCFAQDRGKPIWYGSIGGGFSRCHHVDGSECPHQIRPVRETPSRNAGDESEHRNLSEPLYICNYAFPISHFPTHTYLVLIWFRQAIVCESRLAKEVFTAHIIPLCTLSLFEGSKYESFFDAPHC